MLQCMIYALLGEKRTLTINKMYCILFVYNALVSLPHSFLFIHPFILSNCGVFFLIGHGLGPVPPLSDSPFYIVVHTALTSLLTECYYPEQNKLELCYPVEHISLISL